MLDARDARVAARSATSGRGSGHGRRLGELLVDEQIVSREQLDEALRVQTTLRNYIPVGQLLMMRGWLSRAELTALLRRHGKRARLGELLVKAGRITVAQLQTALAHQQRTGQPLGHTLISLGHVTETTMREALCTQLHINFFDLDRVPLDPALGKLVTQKYATRRRVVPLFRSGQILVVAVDDPTDMAIVEELQHLLRLRVEVVTSTTDRILGAITRLYSARARPAYDPSVHQNIMIGNVHDREVAELAATVLKVRILPPRWQPETA
jgi:hypothetical protein